MLAVLDLTGFGKFAGHARPAKGSNIAGQYVRQLYAYWGPPVKGLEVAMTLQPFVRLISFNFWLAALDVLYHLSLTAGPHAPCHCPHAFGSHYF